MTNNKYLPEGMRQTCSENMQLLSSMSGLERAMASGIILESTVLACDKNLTLTLDLGGIRGTIAAAECAYTMDGERLKDIAIISRVGKVVCFKILGFDRDENGKISAVLSRRAAQAECMYNFLHKLTPGDIVPSRVTHLEPFGAFVDIGCGIVSLMSVDCISVSRIAHPKERFTPGMYIRSVIKTIDYDTGRIFVTHKELLGTWEENVARFNVAETVTGIVRSIEEYGIFVELSANLAGLAEPKEGIIEGQSVAVFIKNIIHDKMKVKLVLIDNYQGAAVSRPFEYMVDEDVLRMDSWRYSPDECGKVIETVFSV